MAELPLIGLVGCCGPKLDHPAPARDLYQSQLFKLSRAYVEARCSRWAILSAKLGVVMPEDVIEPYDVVLSKLEKGFRERWQSMVARDLISKFGKEVHFVVLAGEDYAAGVPGYWWDRPIERSFPLRGMGIGKRLQFLRDAAQSNATTMFDASL